MRPAIDGSRHRSAVDPEPDHGGEGAAPAGHRRPDGARDGDGDRHRHRQPDDDVERPAGSIGEQHQGGRDRPARHEGGADQAKLEPADPHVAESSGVGWPGRKYRGDPDRRVIAWGAPRTRTYADHTDRTGAE